MPLAIGMGLGMEYGGGAGYSPLSEGSALEMWVRADLGVTLGATVTWADQSGKGRNATQSTASKQPTVATVAGLNNQSALLFDGTDDSLTTAIGTAAAQPLTLMVVVRTATRAATMTAIDGPVGGPNRIIIGDDGANIYGYAGGSINSAVPWGNNTSRIVLFEANGASSAVYSNSYTTTIITGNAGAGAFQGASIGASGAAQYWPGHIAEFVAVAGASAALRQRLMQYASTRYAITLT